MESLMSLDGNAEQVRAIATHLADAFGKTQHEMPEQLKQLEHRLEEKIDAEMQSVLTKMKFWIVSAVLTQVLALSPIVFFLGGIYNTNNAALELLQKQQSVLDKRGEWISERERWEQSVEMWAGPKGYQPPRYRGGPE